MRTERTPDPATQEKRLKVQMLLNDPKWRRRSTRWVAREAGASYALVARIRREREPKPEGQVRTVRLHLPAATAEAMRRHPSIDWAAVISATVTRAVRVAEVSPRSVPTRRQGVGDGGV
jgi:hypothetical protein